MKAFMGHKGAREFFKNTLLEAQKESIPFKDKGSKQMEQEIPLA